MIIYLKDSYCLYNDESCRLTIFYYIYDIVLTDQYYKILPRYLVISFVKLRGCGGNYIVILYIMGDNKNLKSALKDLQKKLYLIFVSSNKN